MVRSWLICVGLGMVLSLTLSSAAPAADAGDRERIAASGDHGRRVGAVAAARADSPPEPGTSKHRGHDKISPARPSNTEAAAESAARPESRGPVPTESDRVQARLGSTDALGSPSDNAAAGKFRYLEIEVSHSQHFFKLLGKTADGGHEKLHECNVGLGSREFPTPVGVYYVTHIYDESPWWIPPPNRAWAAGQSPSRRIYGGTMAPLLKKIVVKDKKVVLISEDKIEKKVKLDDYGYRFHGTNAPRSIGRNQSHGCVRMIPADAKRVADLIKQHVGIASREESENGTFVVLKAPVRLNLIR